MPKSSTQHLVCVEVARLLKREREQRQLSMNAVAESAGLSQQMVSYVERGMRNPTLETLLRMADAIGVRLPKLIDEAVATVSGKARR